MASPNLICEKKTSFNHDHFELVLHPNETCQIYDYIRLYSDKNLTKSYNCEYKDKYFNYTIVNNWDLICGEFLFILYQHLYMIYFIKKIHFTISLDKAYLPSTILNNFSISLI